MRRLTTLIVLAAALVFVGSTRGEFLNEQSPVPAVGTPGGPSRVLSTLEQERFRRGRLLFDRDFHLEEGLGTPELNGDSCRACHLFPAIGGAGGLDVNVTRFGYIDPATGTFTDLGLGQIAEKLRRPDTAGREDIPTEANVFEQRNSPSLFGLGLLEEVPESAILANADPQDLNGDGIRGTPRYVDVGGGQTELGRFGWKAQIPRLDDFVKNALGEELGLTTPDDGRGLHIVTDADVYPDPEISDPGLLEDMAFFLKTLAPPVRTGSNDPAVLQGEVLFETVGCALCHVPELPGPQGPVRAYTDLLLHDVSPSDYRGVAEPGAGIGWFRTPPLWGVKDTFPYLHDGRAETLMDAIAAHAGEAAAVTAAFNALSPSEQAAVIAFLEDL